MRCQKVLSTTRQRATRALQVALAVLLLLAPGLFAGEVMVQQLNLGGLVDRADKIFRGTILGVSRGTVQVGGGSLDTVTYKIEVTESFKGDYIEKGGKRFAEVTMVTGRKSAPVVGNYRALSALPDALRLQVGQEYLLMTTAPSAIGLSTTVGLGQGCFEIAGVGKSETAMNAAQNRGLVSGSPGGAMSYSELASRIRTELGN